MSDILKDLAKAKAVFQQRTVRVLEKQPIANNEKNRNDEA